MRCGGESGLWKSLFLAVPLALLAPNLPAQSDRSGDLPAIEVPQHPRPRHLGLLRTLDELSGEAFAATAEAMCASSDLAAFDAVILRAGSAVPPGLPEGVQERREAMRSAALLWLRGRVEHPDADQAKPWVERLSALLAGEGGEELWCAAAHAAAALARYELAPALAAPLDDPASPRRCQASRATLFTLYRRWFANGEEFARFHERAAGRGRDELFLDDLEAEQQVARELRSRLIDLVPQREGIAALADSEPLLRVRAARAVRRGVGEGRVPAEEAIEALFSCLEGEHDAQALRAMLDALLQLLASSPPDSPRVARLRDLLGSITAGGQHDLEWPVLEALARMPWSRETNAGPASLTVGFARVSELFRRIVLSSEVLDSDVLIQVIDLWRNLHARVGENGARSATHEEPAREAVRYLLTEAEISHATRLAAASSVALLLPRDPAEAAGEIVALTEHIRGGPDLEVELLRALAPSDMALDPADPAARRLRHLLLDRIGHENAALRGRALELLGELLARGPYDAAAVDTLVERMCLEPVHELQWALLATLERTGLPGRAGLVERVLSTPAMDELVRADARRVGEVAYALRSLAGDDAFAVLRCAQRVLDVDDPQGRTQRLELALAAVLSLPLETARSLEAAAHRSILGWAFELRERAGLRPLEEGSLVSELERLVEVHAHFALDDPDGDRRSLAHAIAVLSGDLVLARDPPGDPAPVIERFAEALTWAGRAGNGEGGVRTQTVLRDRARFLHAAGLEREALADYRTLLEEVPLDGTQIVETGTVLQLSDLRRAAALLVDPRLGHAQDPQSAALACELGLALVRQESWQRLPPQTRLQDLRDFTERALTSGAEEHRIAARAIFADLPELPRTTPDSSAANGSSTPPESEALWRGLLRERGWHETLLELRDRLLAAPPALDDGSDRPPAEDGPRSTAPRDPPRSTRSRS